MLSRISARLRGEIDCKSKSRSTRSPAGFSSKLPSEIEGSRKLIGLNSLGRNACAIKMIFRPNEIGRNHYCNRFSINPYSVMMNWANGLHFWQLHTTIERHFHAPEGLRRNKLCEIPIDSRHYYRFLPRFPA